MVTVKLYFDPSDPEDSMILDWLSGLGHNKTKMARMAFRFMMESFPNCDRSNINHIKYLVENGFFPCNSNSTGSSASVVKPIAVTSSQQKRARKATKKPKPQERSPTAMPRNRPQLIVPGETPETVAAEKPKEAAIPEVTVPNIPIAEMTHEQRGDFTQTMLKKMQSSGGESWDNDF